MSVSFQQQKLYEKNLKTATFSRKKEGGKMLVFRKGERYKSLIAGNSWVGVREMCAFSASDSTELLLFYYCTVKCTVRLFLLTVRLHTTVLRVFANCTRVRYYGIHTYTSMYRYILYVRQKQLQYSTRTAAAKAYSCGHVCTFGYILVRASTMVIHHMLLYCVTGVPTYNVLVRYTCSILNKQYVDTEYSLSNLVIRQFSKYMENFSPSKCP